MQKLIIVEVGKFADSGARSYQLFELLTNGTYKLAKKLPDGGDNDPMYFRDARTRMAQMFTVKAYGSAHEEEE